MKKFKLPEDRNKLIFWLIFAFEILSALFFLIWYSPYLASRHLDEQTMIPARLVMISLVVLVISFAAKTTRFTKLMILTFLAWSALLLLIGWSTECPVCGTYWFYAWTERIGLYTYPVSAH